MHPGLRTSRRGAGAVLAAAGALAGLVAAAEPAQAHAALISSNPVNGATVAAPPSLITLTFDEALQPRYNAVVVTGPGGTRLSVGAPVVKDRVLRQPVQALVSAGGFTVSYRVVSADGHLVSGRLSFRYAPAAASGPIPADSAGAESAGPETSNAPDAIPSAPANSGRSTLRAPAVASALLVLAAGATLLRRRRRRG